MPEENDCPWKLSASLAIKDLQIQSFSLRLALFLLLSLYTCLSLSSCLSLKVSLSVSQLKKNSNTQPLKDR